MYAFALKTQRAVEDGRNDGSRHVFFVACIAGLGMFFLLLALPLYDRHVLRVLLC